MKLATAALIKKIDEYAEKKLNIPTLCLMERAGEAVARVASSLTEDGECVLILAGKGNNGGDGYAAALLLERSHRVTVCDVFSAGQASDAGKHFLSACKARGINIIDGSSKELDGLISGASLIIDAVFGTGFRGALSEDLSLLADKVNSSSAEVLAVDLPLGVNADTGECDPHTVRAEATVALCLKKPAHLSYPAKEYMGAVSLFSLELDEYIADFDAGYYSFDQALAVEALPKRDATSNKGSFGKTVHITGSEKYRGAAHLALEASLRSGVGITYHIGAEELNYELRAKFPEAIYISENELYCRLCEQNKTGENATRPLPSEEKCHESIKKETDLADPVAAIVGRYGSVLVGSGSGVSEKLCELIEALVLTEGAPLVLDADGLNSIAAYSTPEIFKRARRKIILTPHPLELSRLFGYNTEYINAHRLPLAKSISAEYGVILLLKGAGTVITDGEHTYLNESGSTALAKGGSGDALAGVVAAFAAYQEDLTRATALAAYLHGRAADTLSAELSEFGVTPSDLPREIARHIRLISD
jgi:NAD(P)H-hydrate epimerase